MPATYEPIATNTLSSSAATVEFTSIPQTFTDLVLVMNTTIGSSTGAIQGVINSDTATNYSITRLIGNGSAASSDRVTSTTSLFLGDVATSPTIAIAHFQNYSNTTTNKTIIARGNDSTVRVLMAANLWRSTSAITAIKIQNNAAVNFAIGSMFTLYGIKAA